MNAKRSYWMLLAVAALSASACKDDPAPTPSPEGSSSAASKEGKEKKASAASKLDPLAVKTYRAESCYFGTLSLRQARAAYTASLGGAEPGEGKIPNFGAATKEPEKKDEAKKDEKAKEAAKEKAAPAGSAAPKAAGSAKPSEKPAEKKEEKTADKAAPATSGSAAKLTKPLGNRPRPVPYERHARSCTVAAGIKTPAAPGLDEVLAEFAPYAVQLSKDIAAANSYYAKEEFKGDSFAKGKELHKKLTDGFAKLDELQKKLGDALHGFTDKNKPDASKYTEGQKLANAGVEVAHDTMHLLTGEAVDAGKVKEKVTALDKAIADLKKYGEDHKDDAWARIVAPSLESFQKEAKRVSELADLKTTPPDDLLALVTNFTRVLESQNRGLTRQVSGGGGSGGEFMKKRPTLKVPQGGGDH
jgi:hypothetical protein